jgi:tight adherence protein B
VSVVAGALVVIGVALVTVGGFRRRRSARDVRLALALDLRGPRPDEMGVLGPLQLGRVLELWRPDDDRADRRSRRDRLVELRRELLAGSAGAIGLLLVGWLVAGSVVPGALAIATAAFALKTVSTRRKRRRRQMIETQFPDALNLLASALQVGNPLPRALRTLAQRGTEPLASEISLVVAESELGISIVDAFESMAERVDVEDVRWFARALRIQQSVGGQLGPVVRSIAQVLGARAELPRDPRVLTAEGRASAWVLGALPVVLTLACQMTNPEYLAPLFRGAGLLVLGACAASVAAGITCILRMVDATETG